MEQLTWTRREALLVKLFAERRNQKTVADAVGISVKAVELSLQGIRRYAGVTTTQTLIRIVVDQLGGLI